jgi:uncharacterized protein (TIGR03084 family)
VTDSAPGATVGDVAAEQDALLDVLAGRSDDDWLRPTPARGWDVRDTISHLADTDEMAVDTVRGGPRALNAVAAAAASGEDVTYGGVLRGRRSSPAACKAWWERAARAERDVLAELAPDARVPWGVGMRARSFVAARLMETWAHGLDVRAALRVAAIDTDRLAPIAWLSTRALPYAYSVAGVEVPAAALRVELTLPSGELWTFGPPDAADRITGSAGEYCRVFVRRMPVDATSLRAEGEAAASALAVARAYL